MLYFQLWAPVWVHMNICLRLCRSKLENYDGQSGAKDEAGWVICIHSSSYFSYNDITIMISKNNYNSFDGNIFKSFRCSFSSRFASALANCHDCIDVVRSETNTFSIFFYNRKIIIKRHAHQNEIFKQLVQPWIRANEPDGIHFALKLGERIKCWSFQSLYAKRLKCRNVKAFSG